MAIEGAPDLQESIQARVDEWIANSVFESDPDYISALEEVPKWVLQANGYFLAKASAQVQVLSSDSAEEQVWLHFQVVEGQQYRLREIQFTGAEVFPPSELRDRVPLHDGDIFDLGKIRKGLEALRKLYNSVGYINFVATPDIMMDDDHQLISVFFELDEGKQFRVRSFKVLGLDQEVSDHALKTKLKRGDVFSPQFLEDFYNDNKSLWRADVPPRDNTQIKQDEGRGTVDILVDVRPCLDQVTSKLLGTKTNWHEHPVTVRSSWFRRRQQASVRAKRKLRFRTPQSPPFGPPGLC